MECFFCSTTVSQCYFTLVKKHDFIGFSSVMAKYFLPLQTANPENNCELQYISECTLLMVFLC